MPFDFAVHQYCRTSASLHCAAPLTEQASTTFDEALMVAYTVVNEVEKEQALALISEAQTKAGLIAQALETANMINGRVPRTMALTTIIIAQSKSGLVEQALNLANGIEVVGIRLQLLTIV